MSDASRAPQHTTFRLPPTDLNGVERSVPTTDRPVLLTPTIVVALDHQGAEVAERLASLVRANIRGPHRHDASVVRERFGFIRLLRDAQLPGVTEVQAIAVDPSERLWNVADQTWQYRPFTDERAVSFAAALRQTISDVLHYTLVEEELRDQNIIVQPSNLNVFFVGTLIQNSPLSPDELDLLMSEPPDPDKPSPLSEAVEHRLEQIRLIIEAVRLYAEESASLDLVVRGAFLAVTLPVDAYSLAHDSIQRHGTTLGGLLTPPGAAEYSDSVGYKEPSLHFCALYTDHDDRGAWYDTQQLTNVMASAIYALMQSELMDNDTCATQLGLRDPYAGPYERIVSIAATRSSLPRADLLDYAALQYGAYLLDRLLPAADGPLSSAERDRVGPIADDLIDRQDLVALVKRDAEPLWDKHGRPCQLSHLASDAEYPPPDLRQLILEPQTHWRSIWTEHVSATLRELTRLDGLSDYLDAPLVDDDGVALPLDLPDDAGQFTYDQEPLLLEWHRWRQAMEGRVNHPDDGEVMRRVMAVVQELDRRLWGDAPQRIPLSGPRYCLVLLDLVNERLREIQGIIRRQHLPSPPSAATLDEQLERARVRGLVRANMGVLVALSLLFAPVITYLLLAIHDSPAVDNVVVLLRRTLVVGLPGLNRALAVPSTLVIAALFSLSLLVVGLIVRQWQTIRAVHGMREYARLIRRKYALLMYRDEQRMLDSIPNQILDYRQFLQRSLQATQEATRQAAETLRARATAISDRGFRDVSEYLPTVRGGPQAIYRTLIQPRMADHAEVDLPHLRRNAQALGAFVNAPVQTEEAAIQRCAREVITTLVLGDPTVSEQDPRARLRYLAYQSLQHDMEEAVRQAVTQATLRRAQELQQRTHLMLRTGYRPGAFAFQQTYLVAAIQDVDEKPMLAETTPVRGLDPEMVMYVRVANGVWPRLFEGAGVVLF
jgi:hypothetical protein